MRYVLHTSWSKTEKVTGGGMSAQLLLPSFYNSALYPLPPGAPISKNKFCKSCSLISYIVFFAQNNMKIQDSQFLRNCLLVVGSSGQNIFEIFLEIQGRIFQKFISTLIPLCNQGLKLLTKSDVDSMYAYGFFFQYICIGIYIYMYNYIRGL